MVDQPQAGQRCVHDALGLSSRPPPLSLLLALSVPRMMSVEQIGMNASDFCVVTLEAKLYTTRKIRSRWEAGSDVAVSRSVCEHADAGEHSYVFSLLARTHLLSFAFDAT